MGTVPGVAVLDGYKTFDGQLLPTITRQKAMGIESVITFDAIEFDTVPENAFAVPHRSPRSRSSQSRHPPCQRRRRGRRQSARASVKAGLGGLVPPAYEQQLGQATRVEFASDRTIRERNKISYRFNHWPIWIWVFFIAPGSADLRSVRARLRLADGCLARRRAPRYRHGRSCRQAARRGARALHHPVHRGQAEPALPARLLHVRVERGRHLRGAEHRRPRVGDRHGAMAAAADLRRRVLSTRGERSGCLARSAGCRA